MQRSACSRAAHQNLPTVEQRHQNCSLDLLKEASLLLRSRGRGYSFHHMLGGANVSLSAGCCLAVSPLQVWLKSCLRGNPPTKCFSFPLVGVRG